MNDRTRTPSAPTDPVLTVPFRRVVLPLVVILLGAVLARFQAPLGDLVVLAGFFWAAVLSLAWALPVYVIFSPFTAGLLLQGHHLAVSDALAFLMAVRLLWRYAPGGFRDMARAFFPRTFRWPVVLLLAIAVISLIHAQSHTVAVIKILALVEFFAVVVGVAADLAPDAASWTPTLAALFGTALYEAFRGLEQFLLGVGPHSFQAYVGHIRAFGTFGQPNVLGAFMADILPIGLALYLFGPRGRHRPWLLIVNLVVALTVWASLSRGAWVADVAAIGLMGILAWVSRGRRVVGPYAGYAVVLPGLMFGLVSLLGHIDLSHSALARHLQGGSAAGRAASIFGGSVDTQQRFYIWKAAIHAFRTHLATGVGMGEFTLWVRHHMPAGLAHPPPHAHDIYLELGADTGVLGIVAIVWLEIRWVVTRVRAVVGRLGPLSDFQYALALGALGTFTAFIVQNWVDYMVDHGVIVPLVLMMGFMAGLLVQKAVREQNA